MEGKEIKTAREIMDENSDPLFGYNDAMILTAMKEFSDQQNSTLQQELEKAKELLKRVKVWGVEHGLNMEIYTDINDFLEAK